MAMKTENVKHVEVLPPCPFCGGRVYVTDTGGNYAWYKIFHSDNRHCPATMESGDKQALVSLWSRRHD
jgi:hypothetical protein